MTRGYREQAIDLGDGVFGIVCEPDHDAPTETLWVLFNAGFIHRVGPFRLYVALARGLARRGIACLRFDYPGVGDSIARTSRSTLETTSLLLDRAAAATGYRQFVVAGVCAGADIGWTIAANDPRVAGLAMIDGIAHGEGWFRLARIRDGLTRLPSRWRDWLRHVATVRAAAAGPPRVAIREWPARGVERRQLGAMLQRGCEVFALFTGGTSYFRDRRQFVSTFGRMARSPAVTFDYWPDCDHDFRDPAFRAKLVDAIVDWAAPRFLPTPGYRSFADRRPGTAAVRASVDRDGRVSAFAFRATRHATRPPGFRSDCAPRTPA